MLNRKLIYKVISLTLLIWWQVANASGSQNLSSVVGNVQTNILTLAPLLTIVSYLAGVGFAIAGIIKFKAHKDAPTQVALSIPIVYLAVGAALLFLPSILSVAGNTVFGAGQGQSAATGSTGLGGSN